MEKPEEREDGELLKKNLDSMPKSRVSVVHLEKKPFMEELISNGKLEANQTSILAFEFRAASKIFM